MMRSPNRNILQRSAEVALFLGVGLISFTARRALEMLGSRFASHSAKSLCPRRNLNGSHSERRSLTPELTILVGRNAHSKLDRGLSRPVRAGHGRGGTAGGAAFF